MKFTRSQKKIIGLVAEGWDNKAIADLEGITVNTVAITLTAIYGKMEIPGDRNKRVWLCIQYSKGRLFQPA